MDRVNANLARLIQRRGRLVRRIGRLKRELVLGPVDPKRERDMLVRVLANAPEGYSRAQLARIFRAIFAVSRELVVAQRQVVKGKGKGMGGAARRDDAAEA